MLIVGFDDHEGLFCPKWFYDSVVEIQNSNYGHWGYVYAILLALKPAITASTLCPTFVLHGDVTKNSVSEERLFTGMFAPKNGLNQFSL